MKIAKRTLVALVLAGAAMPLAAPAHADTRYTIEIPGSTPEVEQDVKAILQDSPSDLFIGTVQQDIQD
ncbi:hypothetical protein OV450_7773 [Actinobacteria bacterium OV450]|nr:hypothetical protein OV450_7773 [Actinobacteria bacterium OV450]